MLHKQPVYNLMYEYIYTM